ncbi:hypothetical protein [Bacillus atrophaeus]|uniref:hypothetical protein n=1 Tax=Bacillus atrophaeus TaxID=1452 RepID=UPI00227E6EF3|nr:hypothetical protein [Bacillus atrophaeus]MCY8466428.1 hypothetical protein [Bacillus atrophaeus]MCY8478887.1 hypothetical protein [Bacillus atrophaeus]
MKKLYCRVKQDWCNGNMECQSCHKKAVNDEKSYTEICLERVPLADFVEALEEIVKLGVLSKETALKRIFDHARALKKEQV